MLIRHHKTRTVTTNTNNAIGPTKDVINRTVTAHTDVNSIYVAVNGDPFPTGDGTSGNPFDTLDTALNNLGGKSIITVIRNGYVGAMVFDAPTVDIPASMVIQVVLGETATVKRDYALLRASSSASKNWQNLHYYQPTTGSITPKIIATNVNAERAYYSTDGINYTLVVTGPTPVEGKIVSYQDRIVSIGVGVIAYSDDGITWASGVRTDGGLLTTVSSIAVFNGLWIISLFGSGVKSIFSTDGINYSELPGSPEDIVQISVSSSGVWIAEDGKGHIYRSTDGYTWDFIFAAVIGARGAAADPEGRWVSVRLTGNIYYSENGIVWLISNAPPKIWQSVRYLQNDGEKNGLWVACASGTGELYSSLDRINWTQITNVSGDFYDIAFSDHFGYNMALQSSVIQYSALSVIDLLPSNDSIEINGFYLDGQDIIPNGIFSRSDETSDPDSHVVKWCEPINITTYALHLNELVTVLNNIFHCLYGIRVFTTTDIKNNIVYECQYGIYNTTQGGNVIHNTIYNCDNAYLSPNAGSAGTVFKDNIIDRAITAYKSNETAFSDTVLNNILNGLVSLTTIDSTNFRTIKVLYHDELADPPDFHLRHIEEDYPVESPGILDASDSLDRGAWNVTFTVSAIDFTGTFLHGQTYDFERSEEPVLPESGRTFSGAYKRTLLSYKKSWNITPKPAGTSKLIREMRAIAGYDDVLQVFPVGNGTATFPRAGAFTWETPADQKGIVKCIPHSLDVQFITLALNGERPEGWFLWILNVSGAIAPWTEYPMKIIQYDEGNQGNPAFYLENLHSQYSGTGFGADGSYNYRVTKGLFAGVMTYTALLPTGELQFSLFSSINKFNIDEWQGAWLYTNHTAALGSRLYFRIESNDEFVNIILSDPFGNEPSLTPGNQYHCVIDLYMCKSDPAPISMRAGLLEGSEYGKHGNDYYSTNVTREENATWEKSSYLQYNDREWTVTIKETDDYEEDGL